MRSCRDTSVVRRWGAQQGEQLDLMADVEVVGRFVQDQQRPALGERAGQQDPLAFPAGQRGEAASGVAGHADVGEGAGDGVPVGGVLAGEARLYGVRPMATTSPTVSSKSSPRSCGSAAMCRADRAGLGARRSVPASSTRPAAGRRCR